MVKLETEQDFKRIKALADFLDVDTDEIDDKFGLAWGNQYYEVLTDKEADEMAADEIRESLWTFEAEFIIKHCKNFEEMSGSEYESAVKSLEKARESERENLNGLIYALIDNFGEFVQDAIITHGRGYFIAGNDGIEDEQDGFYIYRVD